MNTKIRDNERSWVIQIISQINSIVDKCDLKIKRAGGENTVATSGHKRMFPDILLYGDKQRTELLQGWEAKMPDVAITNSEFINDATRKAKTLNLSSFVLWNFSYAVLYRVQDDGEFGICKTWDDTSQLIRTREDVFTYADEWSTLLEQIIYEISSSCFNEENVKEWRIDKTVADAIIPQIINSNKNRVAEELELACAKDARKKAFISKWWDETKQEYLSKEKKPYHAYARTIMLNWVLRVLFAHILKRRQLVAKKIEGLNYDTTPEEAEKIFTDITSRCDFYHVFSPAKYGNVLHQEAWRFIIEFSLFLTEINCDSIDQCVLQDILEETVQASRREICGLYTTPIPLAKILLELSVLDWSGNVYDCCCGSGTIPKLALECKLEARLDRKQAVSTVWASDKFLFPLQIANISMTHVDAVNMACRIFQHDALLLHAGEDVEIVNPENGNVEKHLLPEFDAIVSNLPFVSAGVDKSFLGSSHELGGRADLYCHIALHIAKLLKEGGRAGIITSNAWLGVSEGITFVKALRNRFHIEQVHISGNGKWFDNADVVATILVLQKRAKDKECDVNEETAFFLWKTSIKQFEEKPSYGKSLVQAAWLNDKVNPNIANIRQYTMAQIDGFRELGVSYNALFHGIDWLSRVKKNTKFISDEFKVRRGCRRGCNDLFYPREGEHNIEPEYLKPLFKNAKNATNYRACAMHVAFNCSETKDQLKKAKKRGAISWIEKFENQKNEKGKLWPLVLTQSGKLWYELGPGEEMEIYTMMNPDARLFFGYFDKPTFIDQRLIGLQPLDGAKDKLLLVALLNSVLTLFCVEASGFGRGLGVLDIKKNGVEKCRMWNPDLLSETQKTQIVDAFKQLERRGIMPLRQELLKDDRIAFEKIVFSAFGVSDIYEAVVASLLSLMNTRSSVKNSRLG